MQIVCPKCATAYDVAETSLGAEGRSVRCARCRHVWFAAPPVMAEQEADSRDWALPTATGPEAEPEAEPQREAGPDWPADAAGPDLPPEDAPPLAPAGETPDAVAGATAQSGEEGAPDAPTDIETAAALRARRRRGLRNFNLGKQGIALAILVLVAFNAGLIAWRENIVRAMPQTGSFYALLRMPVNLRGLIVKNVTIAREAHEGVSVLVVEGTIENVSKRALDVPRVRFALRNKAGSEIYSWTSVTPRTLLNPGEAYAIRSRLASPPAEGRELVVRFFNRRDVATGLN